MKNNKKNWVKEFFGPTVWKVILTIVATLIMGFFWQRTYCAWGIGGTTNCLDKYLFGISNIFIQIILSILFFYLIFSLLELIVRRLRK